MCLMQTRGQPSLCMACADTGTVQPVCALCRYGDSPACVCLVQARGQAYLEGSHTHAFRLQCFRTRDRQTEDKLFDNEVTSKVNSHSASPGP